MPTRPEPIDLAAIEARHLQRQVSSIHSLALVEGCMADLEACLEEVRRLRAILTELRARMVNGDHPVNRRRGTWGRAPEDWVALVDLALPSEVTDGAPA